MKPTPPDILAPALGAGEAPPSEFAGWWTAFVTLLVKEVLRFARIWIQTILPPAVTTALYFVIFGKLLGAQMPAMDGIGYPQYIAPGLIMLAIITNSYANVVSSFYGSKFQHNIEELLVAPMPNWLILAGFVGGGVLRGLAVGVVVTMIALAFTDLHVTHWGVTVGVVFLTAVLFSLAGLINGIYANSFDDIAIVPTFVLTPLTYLGGIFYSINQLSGFWQGVSLVNPILYMVNAFRYGILGVSDIGMLQAFSLIGAFVLGLGAFALWLLRRGVGIRN